jgi:hypothetical protein
MDKWWKLLLAAVAAVVPAGLILFGIHLVHVAKDEKKEAPVASTGGFTLFGGIGQPPQSEFTIPTIKVYGGVTGRFNLEGLTVTQFVQKYRVRAAGNPHIAFKLYQAEALCADLPTTKERARTDKQYVQFLIDDRQACEGVTPALEYERYTWLLQAAQAGVDEARIAYFLEGPQGYVAGDPTPAEWAGNVMNFLQASAVDGNRNAMFWLSNAYSEGILAAKDPQRALAYRVAELTVRPGDPVDLTANPTIKRLSAGLSPAQIAAAIERGRTIAGRQQ